MSEVDIERARGLLKVAAVVTETHSGETRVLFLDRQKYIRAKLLLSGAGLIEDRSDEDAFHPPTGLYQLNILPEKKADFLELLPKADIGYEQHARIKDGDTRALTEVLSTPIPEEGRPLIISFPALNDITRSVTAQFLHALQVLYHTSNPDDKRTLF